MTETVLGRLRQNRQQALGAKVDLKIDTTLEGLKAELAKYPETHRHSAIVLEKDLDRKLTQFCKEQKITVEVFLEAAWLRAIEQPKLLSEIVTEAKNRYANRKKAGRIRRLITMLETQDS